MDGARRSASNKKQEKQSVFFPKGSMNFGHGQVSVNSNRSITLRGMNDDPLLNFRTIIGWRFEQVGLIDARTNTTI